MPPSNKSGVGGKYPTAATAAFPSSYRDRVIRRALENKVLGLELCKMVRVLADKIAILTYCINESGLDQPRHPLKLPPECVSQ